MFKFLKALLFGESKTTQEITTESVNDTWVEETVIGAPEGVFRPWASDTVESEQVVAETEVKKPRAKKTAAKKTATKKTAKKSTKKSA
jgi:hypothetical protein